MLGNPSGSHSKGSRVQGSACEGTNWIDLDRYAMAMARLLVGSATHKQRLAIATCHRDEKSFPLLYVCNAGW
jgi:hypothetical protein